jgi:hypothetical protein
LEKDLDLKKEKGKKKKKKENQTRKPPQQPGLFSYRPSAAQQAPQPRAARSRRR